MKYFISAPFGNYIKLPNTISVTGSWTLKPRPGLFPQILKTLRYTKTGWRNKIGLRNAGVIEGLKRTIYTEVLSLAAISKNDWINLEAIVPTDQNVEINISCPNLSSSHWPYSEQDSLLPGFEQFPKTKRRWCICKIPPTSSHDLIDQIVDSGYSQIHASNTLYSIHGGLSGKLLIPYTLRILEYIKKTHPHVEVIAGGGVTDKNDVIRYRNAGADHISMGTVCFTPW